MSTNAKRALPENKSEEEAASSGSSIDVAPRGKRPKNGLGKPAAVNLEADSSVRTTTTRPEKLSKKAPAQIAQSRPASANAAPNAAAKPSQIGGQSAPSKPGEQCLFLELPAEIRNEIYTLTLIHPSSVFVHPSPPYILEAALLAVNRQVRSETLGLWYSDNTFAIDGSNPAVRFLRALSDQKLRALRTLRIQTTVVPGADYIETRINQLMREFKPRGLNKHAIHFTLSVPGGFNWVNLEKLKRVVNGEEG